MRRLRPAVTLISLCWIFDCLLHFIFSATFRLVCSIERFIFAGNLENGHQPPPPTKLPSDTFPPHPHSSLTHFILPNFQPSELGKVKKKSEFIVICCMTLIICSALHVRAKVGILHQPIINCVLLFDQADWFYLQTWQKNVKKFWHLILLLVLIICFRQDAYFSSVQAWFSIKVGRYLDSIDSVSKDCLFGVI